MQTPSPVPPVTSPLIVRVPRMLTISNRHPFRGRVAELLARGERDLVLDLSSTQYVDSGGMAVLVGLRNLSSVYGASLCLAGLTHEIRELFELGKLVPFFSVLAATPDGRTDSWIAPDADPQPPVLARRS